MGNCNLEIEKRTGRRNIVSFEIAPVTTIILSLPTSGNLSINH